MKLKKGMIEVFLTFHDEGQAQLLLDTANRWMKCKDAYPSIIEVPEGGFEIKRRVLADKLAKNNVYIIADILCVPAQPAFISAIKELFKSDIGMAGLGRIGIPSASFPNVATPYPVDIRICRKGVISKWPVSSTTTYDFEHAEAIKKAGKKVEMFNNIHYMRLGSQEPANA